VRKAKKSSPLHEELIPCCDIRRPLLSCARSSPIRSTNARRALLAIALHARYFLLRHCVLHTVRSSMALVPPVCTPAKHSSIIPNPKLHTYIHRLRHTSHNTATAPCSPHMVQHEPHVPLLLLNLPATRPSRPLTPHNVRPTTSTTFSKSPY
jgi:hypothetical protein